jgi:hypothetical protein
MTDDINEDLMTTIMDNNKANELYDKAVWCLDNDELHDYISDIMDLLPSEFDENEDLHEKIYDLVMDARDDMPVDDESEGEEW